MKVNIQWDDLEDPMIKDVDKVNLSSYLDTMLSFTKEHTFVLLFNDSVKDCLVTDNYKTIVKYCTNIVDEQINEIYIQLFKKSDYEDIFGYLNELYLNFI